MKTIKKYVILITFCINIMLCFASCAYFSAAETKMQEIREIQHDAQDALNTPSLFSDMSIEELEKAVDQDLITMHKKRK